MKSLKITSLVRQWRDRRISEITLIAIGTFIAALIYTGCKKESDNTTPASSANSTGSVASVIGASNDNNIAQATFVDADFIANAQVSMDNTTPTVEPDINVLGACARVTAPIQLTPSLKVVTIDYGTTDCLTNDGNYRRGKIIIASQAYPYTRTVTFSDYYLNFNKVSGSIVAYGLGFNSEHHLFFNVKIDGQVTISGIYSPSNTPKTINYTANLLKEKIVGVSTATTRDDVWLISGSATGVTKDGIPFTATIDQSSPLRKEISFPHYTSGRVSMVLAQAATAHVNSDAGTASAVKFMSTTDYSYINGYRDNLAKIAFNGSSYVMDLGAATPLAGW